VRLDEPSALNLPLSLSHSVSYRVQEVVDRGAACQIVETNLSVDTQTKLRLNSDPGYQKYLADFAASEVDPRKQRALIEANCLVLNTGPDSGSTRDFPSEVAEVGLILKLSAVALSG
jgi:hypothetical protein